MSQGIKLKDGIIHVDGAPASWGFTSARFAEDSYLWKTGKRIMISSIFAKHAGNGYFSALVKAIEGDGFKVAVPTPLGQMTQILTRWGFKPSLEQDCQVWTRA
jgi:hypothetical protein